MPKEEQRNPVAERLDAMLRLLLDEQRYREEGITIGDQILVLKDAGLKSSEIGKILGVESNQLTKYIIGAKNKRLKDKLARKTKGKDSD